MTSSRKPILLEKIERAIRRRPETTRVRVSITAEPEEFRDPDTGETYLVKWLSWTLLAGLRALTEPELEVVGDWLTEEQIQTDFAEFLPRLEATVDNEIAFGDD